MLVGLQAGHREQALEDFEFVALGEFGEFGRGGCDQDQGIVRAALPSRLVARRSPPARRLALPAAPVLLKRPNPISTLYIERYALSGRNSRTYFATPGIETPQLGASLQYLAI
ncbi:hypothetical protein RX327_22690 [Bradyrhizobium sp. BEA-2-5]|uniref:hypothetical protein n=1 Tax=Bradyrhizobium TaxID=374 RepID=UPI00067D4673|nr:MULTISPECIES: hypothetical protein [Bradyrhizobium]WOH78725.1 hypothetical protein RX327_22690 [Bradyrhizobium sp. BEA-2-5]